MYTLLNGKMEQIVLIFLSINLLVLTVTSSGVLEIDLISFTNDIGVISTGACCSGQLGSTTGRCNGTCRTFFTVCVKQFEFTVMRDPPCTFGEMTTPVLGNNSFAVPQQWQSFVNPIALPFQFNWPGDFSLIIEVWHDKTGMDPTADSPRSLIFSLLQPEVIAVSPNWTQAVNRSGSKQLTYAMRVVCDSTYYGSQCVQSCVPRDDALGHYTCSSNGTIVCMDGWTGNFCSDVSKCLPGCDSNHGTCSSPNECKCKPGYQGKFCDQCIPYPGCVHGTCQRPWQCLCATGWSGTFCNLDTNYCEHNRPCQNGATCMNVAVDAYQCQCLPGFTGVNCDVAVDNCQNTPCLNGGVCMDIGGSYLCSCPRGFQGGHCEAVAPSCKDNPCKNGAQCQPTTTGSTIYQCICTTGYQGVNCDQKQNACSSNPCIHGQCTSQSTGTNSGYTCTCNPGYQGRNCETLINDCDPNPCMNGATCVDIVGVLNFLCYCPLGYTGTYCEASQSQAVTMPSVNLNSSLHTDGISSTIQPLPVIADHSVMDKQVALFVSVGVGIPSLIAILVLLFVCVRSRRRRTRETSNSVQDNRRNEEVTSGLNNQNKKEYLATDVSSNYKITNEKLPNRTIVINKNNLNSVNTPVNKTYDKDFKMSAQSKDLPDRQQETARTSDAGPSALHTKHLALVHCVPKNNNDFDSCVNACTNLEVREHSNPCDPSLAPYLSSSVEARGVRHYSQSSPNSSALWQPSGYQNHIVKPSVSSANPSSNPIYFVESSGYNTSKGVLATEV